MVVGNLLCLDCCLELRVQGLLFANVKKMCRKKDLEGKQAQN